MKPPTRAEVDQRQPDVPDAERAEIAHRIAIGALRYFMLRFARNTIIAFDFKDALSFEGETGPYCQYAVVRIRSIFQKADGAREKGSKVRAGRQMRRVTAIFSPRRPEMICGN